MLNLIPGEYSFKCRDCAGEGTVEMINFDDGALTWEKCPECNGEGILLVDDEEAAELISFGQYPISGPTIP